MADEFLLHRVVGVLITTRLRPPSLATMASEAELSLRGTSMYRHTAMEAANSGSKGLWAARKMDTSFRTEEYAVRTATGRSRRIVETGGFL